MKKCVLAYSGGLDTSVMIPWLSEKGYEVFCILADVGQKEDLNQIKQNAYDLGAKECDIISCENELSHVFEYSCFLGAKYENQYFLGTALTRPFIAKGQIEYAKSMDCKTLVHGATGKGNDQIRFEYAYKTLGKHFEIISPWKFWEFHSRKSLITYLENKGFSLGFSEKKDYSVDRNVWHTSIEGGDLEQPEKSLNLNKILSDNNIVISSDIPDEFEIEYKKNSLKINGKEYSFFCGVESINTKCLAKWSLDLLIENRQTGIKSRGLYITPGAKILYKALEGLVVSSLNKKAYEHYQILSQSFSDAIYNGEYFSLQYKSITSGADSLMKNVSGKVVVKTSPILHVSKVIPDKPIFREEICTFEDGDISHSDAIGFINLSWLSADGGCSQ